MKQLFLFITLLVVPGVHAQDDLTGSRQNALTKAIRKVSPAVVGINVVSIKEYTYRNPFFNDEFFSQFFPKQRYYDKVKGLGSGFLISEDGYILTNEHVVLNAVEVVVTLTDGSKYPAQIVGMDRSSDIALLKIKPDRRLPFLRFGDSDDLIIGEWSIALGNPFGLFDISNKPIVTVGVISAINQDFGVVEGNHVYQGMIQTDAAINGGNSGGPLVNALGEVIGINTFIYSGNTNSKTNIGIGFAIPINRVARILDDLKEKGAVDRNFTMGFKYQPVDRMLAQYLKMTDPKGIVISEIARGGPADQGGLKVGDVITKINGRTVAGEYDFQKIVLGDDLRVGDVVSLDIIRDGKEFTVRLKLSRS